MMSSVTITYSNTACEVYRSKGLPKISFFLQVAYMFIYIPVIYVSAHKSFYVLCVSSCLVRVVPVVLDFIMLRLKFRISFMKIVKNTYIQLIATIVMAMFGYVILKCRFGVPVQIISILACIIIYFGVIMCFPQMRKDYFPIGKAVLKLILKKLSV